MNSQPETDDSGWDEKLMAMANELPREREPGRLLEERTIAALRKRGLIRDSTRSRLRPGWVAGGVAAAIALFASGLAVGQWLATRSYTNALLATSTNDAMHTAAHVQRAGTQYVTALQALARFADSTNVLPWQGREVALTALYAAANEVARFAPNDPLATEILRGFQRAGLQQAAPNRPEARQIVWF